MREKYYGEMILSYIIILMHIFSLIEWTNNQEKNIVTINKLKRKECIFSLFISGILIVLYNIILVKIETSYSFLNAISTIIFLLGNYFCFRRSIFQFYAWIIYEIIFITLWAISAINGTYANMIFFVGGLSELIYNIIGIFKWNKMFKNQQKINIKLLKYSKIY